MGKAAENERIKLRPTRFNNLSVGISLGGIIIPYLAIFQKVDAIEAWTKRAVEFQLTSADYKGAASVVLPFLAALWAARVYRRRAIDEIRKIAD
jgi:hypothetical protein